ncbi:MAG: GNAT family N-acetyltransferase [Anaerolineales bacterium]|nr:GNAT family N-acetyltransferase [Anaerolineales bacterium]
MLSLRPMQAGDQAFSFTVYAGARLEEMAPVDWAPGEEESFLRTQFDLRERQYRSEYPDAEWKIILRDNVPVGTMITSKTAEAIHLVDLALLAEARRAGIGTAILRGLQREGKKVNLSVLKNNPAARLYSRLGFKPVSEDPMCLRMEWNPR